MSMMITSPEELPQKPGVYIMHNSDDEIIYVGKAKRLKSRVQSYFRDDEKEALNAEQLLLPRIARILNALKPYSISDWEFILSKTLKHRHFAYDLTKPFQPQFETNMKELIEILNERLKTK